MSAILINAYQKAVDAGDIEKDEAQLAALSVLQLTFDRLTNRRAGGAGSDACQTTAGRASGSSRPTFDLWDKLTSVFRKPVRVKGVYLYGPVGRGKTFLMDLFYENLPLKKKLRMHFYQFMKMTHDNLKELQGHKNPLKIFAKTLSKKAKVICFDEFFVTNIVDAMLLANLLEALYQENITLLATSNIAPDGLYEDGLQRDRFEPAIELLKENNVVIDIDNQVDYRLGKADYDRAYYYPQSSEVKEMLLSRFKSLATSPVAFNQFITVDDRQVKTRYSADNILWFDFLDLCSIPRGTRDYLELSQRYDTIFLSGLRHIKKRENDLICNFVSMVDVFYDAGTKLIILAAVPIQQIYTEGKHAFEFERTVSRLLEMQSEAYLNAD